MIQETMSIIFPEGPAGEISKKSTGVNGNIVALYLTTSL